jgi:hypothetical protein
LLATPTFTQASDVHIDLGNVKIQSGNTTITFGDRDKRGYYWDGGEWRDPVDWDKHHAHSHDHGEQNGKGHSHHCPPGQAKKGNC